MLYDLALIFIFGIAAGYFMDKIKLPKLLGYMIAGFALGISGFNCLGNEIMSISADLRQMALIIILTRAGLNLKIDDLKRIGKPAILMSFLPACFEIMGIVLILCIFMNYSLIDSLIIGSVVAAVSPAVIVPRMIKLIDEGYNHNHHLPELILAGASVDDVFVIVLFTTFVNSYNLSNINVITLLKAPISIILGVILGVFVAHLIKILFDKTTFSIQVKFIIFLSMAFLLIKLEKTVETYILISGLIAIMVMGMKYKELDEKTSFQLANIYNGLWQIFEIILFVLLGAITNLTYAKIAGFEVVLVIVIGLIFRSFGVYLSCLKMNITVKEKIFLIGSYMPKATVQAAISSIPLMMNLPCGEIVITYGVVSILLTAPIGAILIDKSYKKLLSK